MAQMRTKLRLVLKHVTGGAEKINAVNYLAKPPPPNDECYYVEDSYAVKAQRTRKSDTGRNTFAVQSTHNPATDEIREEMAQMRIELGLKLKHVTGGAEKINAVNYLAKPPPPIDECYYEEDSYAVDEQMGSFRPSAQGSNQENQRQGQGNQGWIYGNYNCEVHYV